MIYPALLQQVGQVMGVRYPAHLFIRVDRDLRAALLKGAAGAGESVSELARRVLRASVSDGAVASPSSLRAGESS